MDDRVNAVAVEELEGAGLEVGDGSWRWGLRWYLEVGGRRVGSMVLVLVGVDVDVGGGCHLEGETTGFEGLDDLCACACGDEDVVGEVSGYEEDRSGVGQ